MRSLACVKIINELINSDLKLKIKKLFIGCLSIHTFLVSFAKCSSVLHKKMQRMIALVCL